MHIRTLCQCSYVFGCHSPTLYNTTLQAVNLAYITFALFNDKQHYAAKTFYSARCYCCLLYTSDAADE